MSGKTLLLIPVGLAALGLSAWGGFSLFQRAAQPAVTTSIPSTVVRRGDVAFTVTAKGELQGGNSEMLAAPMTGGREMAITFLRTPGELVAPGDVVVRFDTTEQDFELREAEADLAEAEQEVIKAQAESVAKEEETRYALLQAQAQVRLAELETRKNPLVAAITARQNTLALEAARDRLRQLEQDVTNRAATNEAAIALQEAARKKAKVRAETAQRNIASMTLNAASSGYVAVQQNQNMNMMYTGMELPIFQLGDTVRAGMTVAQIPDLKNWEITARIGELDRGHLAVEQPAEITVPAVPHKRYTGKLKDIGGTAGPFWDRRFECKIALVDPSPELRQGMSAKILIRTGIVKDALWVPSQALFERDGKAFVYLLSGTGFQPRDVELVRRSESQVVLKGLTEGQVVALASPDQQRETKGRSRGVLEALPGS